MKHIIYFIILLTVLGSCQEDLITSESIIPEIPRTTIIVESSIIGKIVDDTGNPIVNTEVVLAGETRLSNDLGYFQFENVQLDRYGSLMTAEKAGYILGLRRISLHAGTTNYVEIALLSDLRTQGFDATKLATIENEEGVTLKFSANSISTSSGQDYEGTVNVNVHYIDPTAANINSVLPGSLEGITAEGTMASLKSYAMISVELTDDAGEELQVKTGNTVSVGFPVPESLLDNAPQTIPLWYLDENTGIWKEEGSATLIDDHYVGEVSHFSYWNCDIPGEFVTIEGTVCNSSIFGCKLLRFTEFTVLDSDNEIRLKSRTDSEGKFTILVPINLEATIDFIQICDDIMTQVSIGPFSEDQNLGILEIASDLSEISLEATVTDCEGSSVQEGAILINDDIYIPIIEGVVMGEIILCDKSDITARAFNDDFSKVSELITLSYSETINTTFNICEENITGICPSNIAGEYEFITKDIMCPGTNSSEELIGIVTISSVGLNDYTFSDWAFGAYDRCYGGGQATGELSFNDDCGVVCFTGFVDSFGDTWTFESSVDGDKWNISWSNTYNEKANSTVIFPGGVPFTLCE